MGEPFFALTEPTEPPPRTDRPMIWFGGRWWEIITDTTDGLPDDLSYVDNAKTECR